MADQPMAGNANADADANPPDQPAKAANGEKQDCPGQLLPHPGPFHEGIEPVVGEPRFQPKFRWVFQHELAVQLPPGVAPKACPVTGVVVAYRLALRPVAK